VDNAIKYTPAGGHVEIRTAPGPQGGAIVEVRDDGPGAANGAPGLERPGVGLANTRARLARLYGAGGTLDVSDAAGGGVEVRVTLPYRPAPGAESSAR